MVQPERPTPTEHSMFLGSFQPLNIRLNILSFEFNVKYYANYFRDKRNLSAILGFLNQLVFNVECYVEMNYEKQLIGISARVLI